MEKGFNIEIYYNGIGMGHLKTQVMIDTCRSVGQGVYNKLEPFAREIDLYGGIRIDINDTEDSRYKIKLDFKNLPKQLVDQINEFIKKNP